MDGQEGEDEVSLLLEGKLEGTISGLYFRPVQRVENSNSNRGMLYYARQISAANEGRREIRQDRGGTLQECLPHGRVIFRPFDGASCY